MANSGLSIVWVIFDMHTNNIPKSPSDITANWLTDILTQAGTIQKAHVTGIQTEPIGIGIGFIGRIVQIRLRYDTIEPDAPHTLVAKFPSTDPKLQRYWQKEPSLYEIENRFYKHIAQHTTLRTPKQYYGAFDHANQKGLLLLEDLTALRPGDQVTGSSRSDAEIIVHDMAHFHADFWENDKLRSIDGLASFNTNVEGLHQRYLDAWPAFSTKFADHLTKDIIETNQMVAQHGIAVRNHLATTPQTFVHGDFRSDNLLLDHDAVVVVDWGGYRKGTCMWDLNQFICQSLTIENRRQHEQSLLTQYLQALQSRDIPYDTNLFHHHYRATTFITWIKIVRAMSLNTNINTRAQKLANRVVKRVATALCDHYSEDLIPK